MSGDLKNTVRQLEDKIRRQDEYIAHLEKVAEAYDNLGSLSQIERIDADKTIHAHENLEEHLRIKRIDENETIQAREMVTSLSEIELMHKDLTLRMVLEINRDISSILDRNKLLNHILNTLVQSTAAHRGMLFIFENGRLEPAILKGIDASQIDGDNFKPMMEIVHKTAASRKSSLSELSVDIDGVPTPVSVLCVPMIYKDKLTGVLYADTVAATDIFRTADLEIAEIFSSQAAIAMENAALYANLEMKVAERTKELNDALVIIKNDMMLAKNIQRQVLPKKLDRIGELNFDVRYYPMSDIGGDIYDVTDMGDGKVRVFVADATGHGVQAALVTMLIKAEYGSLKNFALDPASVLAQMSYKFFKDYRALNVFFTCVVFDIYPTGKRIEYASAGHPGQFLISDGKVVSLESTGKLAGALEDSIYRNAVRDFNDDAKLILFTDGLFEEFDADNVEYGEERALATVSSIVASSGECLPVKTIIDRLTDDVEKYMQGGERNDDITVIGIERKG